MPYLVIMMKKVQWEIFGGKLTEAEVRPSSHIKPQFLFFLRPLGLGFLQWLCLGHQSAFSPDTRHSGLFHLISTDPSSPIRMQTFQAALIAVSAIVCPSHAVWSIFLSLCATKAGPLTNFFSLDPISNTMLHVYVVGT